MKTTIPFDHKRLLSLTSRKVFLPVLSIIAVTTWASGPNEHERSINPNLKYPTLKSYQETIQEAAILLDNNNICLYAPKKRAEEAKVIFKYLVKAYDELYNLVGTHTKYKIIVYHFPPRHMDAKGGTSNCTIWYDYNNLELENQQEWQKYKVPHMSGYIEEMAHNFVDATHAQFGWEMIGWTIGAKATKKIACNPIFLKHIEATRDGQKETFTRYRKNNYVFPPDLPANQCDRIHAWILYDCELKYGPTFWPNFFKEIRKQLEPLAAAVNLGDDDMIRNRRYQITLDCFDRLPGLDFKKRLKELQISLSVDVGSLHPEEGNWDRKFMPREDKTRFDKEPPVVIDPNTLPPLHLTVYGGYGAKAKELLENGADIESKDANGRTALHIAAIKGHVRITGMLVEMGAVTSVHDKQGYTPAELAEIYGHQGTVEVLRSGQKK
jgi:hypothetical protein